MSELTERMNADSGEKTWLTPRWLVTALGPFDLDPCCPPEMPWRTAAEMVCRPRDGLAEDWNGRRVWLNPPYGREAVPFFCKMTEHSGGGIALVFARTDTALWHDFVFDKAKAVLFMRGRIYFCRPDGSESDRALAPSALIAYSDADADVLRRVLRDGVVQGHLVTTEAT